MTKAKSESEFQLVYVRAGKEEIVFTSPNRLEVELQREKHIRSITTGYVEIRQA